MTISINTNGYTNYSLQNQSTYRLQNQQQYNKRLGNQSDSLSISQEALAYMSSTQISTILPSGNYTNTFRTDPLTTEEKGSFLTRMVERLSTTDVENSVETEVSNQTAVALSALKETLAGVDLSVATDEEIQSLFTSVTIVLKEARPPRGGHQGPLTENEEGVIPSLSNDAIISTIISQLASSGDEEEDVDSILARLQEALSGVDLSTTSDDEVDTLFETVLELLDEEGLEYEETPFSLNGSEGDLTTDQKKSILTEIISSLNFTEEENEESDTETITL